MNALAVLDAEIRRRKKMQSREMRDGAFTAGSKQHQRRTDLESVRAALAELAEAARHVLRYRRGEGEFDFSCLVGQDRDNAALDAWERVESKLDAALRRMEGK